MDIFYGRVTDSLAHVYVRIPRNAADDPRTVTGWIRGPRCTLSHTLPATIALRDMGSGPTLLGAAALPDPCFWSPQLPALYDVHVELRTPTEVVQTEDRAIGIRRLGAAGRNLLWEGKRWVLRGVSYARSAPDSKTERDASVDDSVAGFREASSAMLVVDPVDAVCCRASAAGVVLVAQLTEAAEVEQQLARLGRWAAVAMAVLPTDVAGSADALRHAAPNLLLAQHWQDDEPIQAADWADVVVCQVSDPARFPQQIAACPLPIVAQRRLNETMSVTDARAECDRLQRDLATGGSYAGYVVTLP